MRLGLEEAEAGIDKSLDCDIPHWSHLHPWTHNIPHVLRGDTVADYDLSWSYLSISFH